MKQPSRHSPAESPKAEAQVGEALRSVYDEALGEGVPKEMLELLGKLN